MPILFCWLQTGICQSFLDVWKCPSIKIQGLFTTKINERQFEKVVTLKFKGFKDFQDAYEPCILQFSSGKSLVLILQYFDHS